MIPQKLTKEIKIMQKGGRKLAGFMEILLAKAKPGVSLKEIDCLADELMAKSGGKPSFKMVRGYHWATCLNVNQGVVHGIPNEYRLKEGDLLSIDVGIFYKGFHTDMAETILVGGKRNEKKEAFLRAGKKALKEALLQARAGKRVGHISRAIEKELKKAGFNPVRNLTGHGVGRRLHEEPAIPCFLAERIEKTPLLRKGMVLAIEVIYVEGKPKLVMKNDNWTVETEDEKLAGLFEHSVLIRKQKPLILTALN